MKQSVKPIKELKNTVVFIIRMPNLRDVKKIKAFFDANIMMTQNSADAVKVLNKSVRIIQYVKEQ